ncbi:Hypothetical_protein [Hexamita inflata]|uniref:Hypothetical_protein n=1 Tax=Hexamita inflata TaxID=28002 RepID=A0AA86USD7_9EUKA|nr:Hypothetical protein HINF_LOCUS50672 [Hexamita inflata]
MDLSAKIQYSELALKIYEFALQLLYNHQFPIIIEQQHNSSISKSSLLTLWSELNLCYTSQRQLYLKSDSVNTIAQRYSQTVINQEAAYVFTYLRSLNVLLIIHNVQEYLFQLNQVISSFLDFQ